jgi:hypothetical protein
MDPFLIVCFCAPPFVAVLSASTVRLPPLGLGAPPIQAGRMFSAIKTLFTGSKVKPEAEPAPPPSSARVAASVVGEDDKRPATAVTSPIKRPKPLAPDRDGEGATAVTIASPSKPKKKKKDKEHAPPTIDPATGEVIPEKPKKKKSSKPKSSDPARPKSTRKREMPEKAPELSTPNQRNAMMHQQVIALLLLLPIYCASPDCDALCSFSCRK